MREHFDIATALDPARSVVIEACAGSGKTWLLVSRIVRLLLDGVPPGEILAITFTRKAAQEMEARLRQWLEELALKDDGEVRQFLRDRAVPEKEIEAVLPRARGLFESFLTARPGITVNTFHGWFLQLLQRAPLESGYGGMPNLLERSSALLEEAWQRFAEDLQDNPDSDAALALDSLFRDCGLANTHTLLENFVAHRAEWWAYTEGQADPLGYALEQLRAEWQVEPEADILAGLFSVRGLDGDLQSYLGLLEANTDTDKGLAADLAAAMVEPDLARRFAAICTVLFIGGGKGTPRARKASGAQAKRLGGAANEERLLALHQTLCARFDEAREGLTAQAAYRFNHAALLCGAKLLDAFQALKADQQALDFGDVEWRVRELLHRSDYAATMQYKLDARYRHILLDEFQDTNPLQWQVMQSWLAASAEADRPPTIFLVGDPKQSIYRFRRAEPRLFEIAAQFLEQGYGAARLSQNASRRCAPAVIATVNKLFAAEIDYAIFHPHDSLQPALPGGVESKPLAGHGEQPEESARLGLRNPLREPRADTEDRRYEAEAERVAAGIREIVGHWTVRDHDGQPRRAEYRDIMLLTRRRTKLEAYEQALKTARIPFVSTRRGGLLDTLECCDLVALLEFLAAPFADLKLAHVLRTPMFGCTDGDLMALASAGEGSWWQRLSLLVEGGVTSAALIRAHRLLVGWTRLADILPVHDLLDRVFFESELLPRYRAGAPEALQAAVAANLHAFLELALAVDAGRYPSLSKFLRELRELSRASDQEAPDEGSIAEGADAVRIHTVHEAKGLEAPVVWLIDAHAPQQADRGYRVILDWPPENPGPRHFSVYADAPSLTRAQRAHLDDEAVIAARENLNLLYVAMTRAKQALIVSGCETKKGGSESWHSKIARAAGDATVAEIFLAEPSPAQQASTARPVMEIDPRLAQPLNIGKRDETEPTAEQLFGIRLHALLEWMAPPLPVLDKVVLQGRLGVEEAEFEPLWQAALGILEAPHLKRFFDPEQYLAARKELPYRSADGESRRIDRLVEFEDEIWVLDFKTGEGKALAARAAPYLKQMREYGQAMGKAFAGKRVRGMLVFGDGEVFEVG